MLDRIRHSIQNYEGLSVQIVKPGLFRLWSNDSLKNKWVFRAACLGAALVGTIETIVAYALTLFAGMAALVCLRQSKGLNGVFFELGAFSARIAKFIPYLLISGFVDHKAATHFSSM